MAGSNVTELLVLGGAAIALVYAMKTGMLDEFLGGGGGSSSKGDDDDDEIDLPPEAAETGPPSTTTSSTTNTLMTTLQNNPAAMEAFLKLSPAEQAQAQQMFAQQQQQSQSVPPGSIPPVWPTYGNQLTGGPTLAPLAYGPYGGPYPGGIPPQQAQYPQGPQVGPGQTAGAVYPQPSHPGQSYPFTGFPRSTMSPAGNPAAPGLLSSL